MLAGRFEGLGGNFVMLARFDSFAAFGQQAGQRQPGLLAPGGQFDGAAQRFGAGRRGAGGFPMLGDGFELQRRFLRLPSRRQEFGQRLARLDSAFADLDIFAEEALHFVELAAFEHQFGQMIAPLHARRSVADLVDRPHFDPGQFHRGFETLREDSAQRQRFFGHAALDQRIHRVDQRALAAVHLAVREQRQNRAAQHARIAGLHFAGALAQLQPQSFVGGVEADARQLQGFAGRLLDSPLARKRLDGAQPRLERERIERRRRI
ncbi:MAG: hypothetical protein BWZ10_03297 [candidate division BRC1 bacterium ADurb.BinA364]|nr:MAG: hypothetical protein BWZ10_03297 [candidate division BRC1 bacterium ADurb.BinA364]